MVVRDEVVVLQERPHRRVDDERGEAQVDDRAATATSGRCAACAAKSARGQARRRRSPCGRRWVRSLFPFGVEVCPSGEYVRADARALIACRRDPRRRHPRQKSVSYWVSGIAIFSPTWWCRLTPAGELQFLGVDVETVDVVEDSFGVVDDATRRGAVAVSSTPATSRTAAGLRSARAARRVRWCWTSDLLGLKGVMDHSTQLMLATSRSTE